MKKVTFFILLATFLTYSAIGQVVEDKRLMSLGQNTALSVDLIHTDKNDVEKAWTKYIKEFDGKTKKNAAREIFTDDATISAMSRNTIDIYSVVNEKGKDAELIVWFDLGGAFLNSEWHPDRYPVAEKMISDFAQKVSRGAVETELASQEAELQKFSDKLIRLRQDKQSLERNIMEYAEKIAIARKKIEDINVDYEITKEKQATKEASVEAVKARLKEFSGIAKK